MATMGIQPWLPRLREHLSVTGRILPANREEALVLVAPEQGRQPLSRQPARHLGWPPEQGLEAA